MPRADYIYYLLNNNRAPTTSHHSIEEIMEKETETHTHTHSQLSSHMCQDVVISNKIYERDSAFNIKCLPALVCVCVQQPNYGQLNLRANARCTKKNEQPKWKKCQSNFFVLGARDH